MFRAALLLGLFLPLHTFAESVEPERLLPATTQVYVRWDGVKAHAEAYRRSARGKVLAGEMGASIDTVMERLMHLTLKEKVSDRLLRGEQPGTLQREQKKVELLFQLPRLVSETGVVAGFEVSVLPTWEQASTLAGNLLGRDPPQQAVVLPEVQLTIVLPGAAKCEEVIALLKLLEGEEGPKFEKQTIRGRKVFAFGLEDPFHWLAWEEKGHIVIVGSTSPATRVVERTIAAKSGMTRHPLLARVKKFNDFEVVTRGFIDGRSLANHARLLKAVDPQSMAFVETTGLLDIKSVCFWEGFEGAESRGVTEAEVGDPSRGLLGLLVPKKVSLADLPPLPEDTHRFTLARANVRAGYDLFLTWPAYQSIMAEFDKGDPSKALEQAREQLAQEIDNTLEVKLGDLFNALGDLVLTYYSPGDGLPMLGQVFAVSVKDERTVVETLDKLGRRLQELSQGSILYRERKFRGVDVREFVVREASPVTISFTVYKGWLVIGMQPQPVQGYILRTQGELPAWKPDEETAKRLAKIPANAGMIQVVDPCPSIQLLFGVAPLASSLLMGAGGEEEPILEPGMLPHPGTVTRHLFPNILWSNYDGKVMRWKSRDSLWLPLEEFGLEWLPLYLGVSGVGL